MWNVLLKRVFISTLLLLTAFAVPLKAQETQAEAKPDELAKSGNGLKNGYRLQEFDDVAQPIQTVVPRSAAMQSRVEALSWYMVGRLFDRDHRNEPVKALDAFRKAVKLDPEAIEIYRNLVPLEFDFDNTEAAVGYATKAVQLDPLDADSLQKLAVRAAVSGRLPEAIKYLEQAVNSPRVEKDSREFVAPNSLLGKLYFKTGQREHAADCYEILFDAIKIPQKYNLDRRAKNELLKDPLTNYEQIGQVLLEANRLKLALEAFELAGKDTKLGEGNLSYNRAKILYLSEKYEEALAELQKYIDSQRISKGRLAYQLLADILAKLNRSDELIQRLETMTENDSRNAPLQYFFADRLVEVGELERARTIYNTMLRNSGDDSGYVGLARVLRKMQKSGELLDVLVRGFARGREAMEMLEPEVESLTKDKALMTLMFEEGRTRANASELKFEEAYLLAKFALALKDAETSGEFYRLALSLNRNANGSSILIQLEMAEMFLKLRKYSQAVEAYNEVLAAKGLNEIGQAMAYSKLADALANENRIDEALEAISKAIDLDDANIEYPFLEARIYSHAKRWDDAVRKFDQLIRDFPDNKPLILICQFSLSNVYVQKGEIRKGEEVLEKVLETNPENSQVNNDLGYLWADQGKNLEQAEKMIRKAIAAEPENAAYLDSLGWVLFKLGKYEEAVPWLEKATEKMTSGGDGTLWDHLGDVLLKTMRIEKAVDAWRTALKHVEEEASPDPQLVERLKDKLKLHESKSEPKPAEKGAP